MSKLINLTVEKMKILSVNKFAIANSKITRNLKIN